MCCSNACTSADHFDTGDPVARRREDCLVVAAAMPAITPSNSKGDIGEFVEDPPASPSRAMKSKAARSRDG